MRLHAASRARHGATPAESPGIIERLRSLIASREMDLVRVYRALLDPPAPNLRGDRDIEYSWTAANCPPGPGRGLDFGSGTSYLAMIAAQRGFEMLAIDLRPVKWFYDHPRLRFRQIDVFDLDIAPASLDLIINCSSVEHVGLGRYGDRPAEDGDLQAMRLLCSFLRPGGTMLLTVPVGEDAVFRPLHRVYGPERLPRLLHGYDRASETYWAKDRGNRWVLVDAQTALRRRPTRTSFGLGCFVLRRPPAAGGACEPASR